jgi:hypothetical protein
MNRWHRKCSRPAGLIAALGVPALVLGMSTAASASPAGHHHAAVPKVNDRPAGFLYGTDSWPITVKGPAPYPTPVLGSPYGGYIGMTGNVFQWQHCGDHSAWSPSNSAAANVNFFTYHTGIGTGVYWFMGGPGVDPHYNGRTSEARAWGVAQAQRALSDAGKLKVPYPIIIADVELPGHAPGISPAPDNGWNAVYTSTCSGVVKSQGINPLVDRADFKGFTNYITQHTSLKAGVYSAPSVWTSIFGTGSAGSVNSSTFEWTYEPAVSRLSPRPTAWCLRGTTTCAQFFGGVTSADSNAVMWQWSGGGGTSNGVGDFDQIDVARTP